MEESTRLTDSSVKQNHHHHHHHHRYRRAGQSRLEFVDDECSTDSGCSSRGSSESNERLSRRGSAERLCGNGSSSSTVSGQCYLHRLRGNPAPSTRSQERLTSSINGNHRSSRSKSSRSWSPSDDRGNHHSHHHHHHHHHHHRHNSRDSPSHSSSPSDAQSSDSDSFKRPSKTEVIKRALQCLKIAKWQENCTNTSNNKEKKQTKKSPRRILREPVSYTYVRGLSGLPTQRVPRNTVQQVMVTCSCHDSVGLYR